jgi:hypothetical protein
MVVMVTFSPRSWCIPVLYDNWNWMMHAFEYYNHILLFVVSAIAQQNSNTSSPEAWKNNWFYKSELPVSFEVSNEYHLSLNLINHLISDMDVGGGVILQSALTFKLQKVFVLWHTPETLLTVPTGQLCIKDNVFEIPHRHHQIVDKHILYTYNNSNKMNI